MTTIKLIDFGPSPLCPLLRQHFQTTQSQRVKYLRHYLDVFYSIEFYPEQLFNEEEDSEILQNREIVKKAVQVNGDVLEVCESFMNDQEIVLLALQNSTGSFDISPDVETLEMCQAAIKSNPDAFDVYNQHMVDSFELLPYLPDRIDLEDLNIKSEKVLGVLQRTFQKTYNTDMLICGLRDHGFDCLENFEYNVREYAQTFFEFLQEDCESDQFDDEKIFSIIFNEMPELYCGNSEWIDMFDESDNEKRVRRLFPNTKCDNWEIIAAIATEEEYIEDIIDEDATKDDLLTAVKEFNILHYVCDFDQMDKQVYLESVVNQPDSFQDLSDELKQDRNFILECVSNNGNLLEFVCEEFRKDREIVMSGLKENGLSIQFIDCEALLKDREVLECCLKSDGVSLGYLDWEIQNDKELVLFAVSSDGDALQYASDELMNDEQVARAAINNYPLAFQYASESIRSNPQIIIHALKRDAAIMNFVPPKVLLNRNLMLECVKIYGNSLRFACDEFKRDREIVMEAVNNYGSALLHASETLQNDSEIVFQAVSNNFVAYKFASEEMKCNRKIAKLAHDSSMEDYKPFKEYYKRKRDDEEWIRNIRSSQPESESDSETEEQ